MNTNGQKNARCENCKWFQPTLGESGECRASAPAGGTESWQRWPEVKVDDWCRAFAPKPGKNDWAMV